MKHKVCFVSHHAYPLLNPSVCSRFGGSEVRAWILGRGLAEQAECSVCFLVGDFGQKPVERFDDIRVYKHPRRRVEISPWQALRLAIRNDLQRIRSFPYYRVRRWRWRMWALPVVLVSYVKNHLYNIIQVKLTFAGRHRPAFPPAPGWRIYRKINADIYCCFGIGSLSASLAWFCRRSGKKLLVFLQRDDDLSGHFTPGSMVVNDHGTVGHLGYYALRYAHRIVAQTHTQLRILRERFSRHGLLLRNPAPGLSSRTTMADRKPGKYALWVGKSTDMKNPALLLRLAADRAEYPFVMILNRSDSRLHDRIMSEKGDNIRLIEYVPLTEIGMFFRDAFVLINTSRREGFPNTFIQAGQHGLPVLSYRVDPDNYIQTFTCGLVAHGHDSEFMSGFDRLAGKDEFWHTCSRNHAGYVRRFHERTAIITRLNREMETLAGRRRE